MKKSGEIDYWLSGGTVYLEELVSAFALDNSKCQISIEKVLSSLKKKLFFNYIT